MDQKDQDRFRVAIVGAGPAGIGVAVGLARLDELMAELIARGETIIPGADAFRLYDTFGFPLDLTRKVLEARGWSIDEDAFERSLEEQRQRAREDREQGREQEEELLAAARHLKATRFVGYDTMAADATVLALFTAGARAANASEGAAVDD